jgi:tetratricopeptide (TPR) repeat protein
MRASVPGSPDPARGGRSDAVRAVFLSAAVFTVYAWGACRTIYVGDSGDLATAVAVLGIPHPSGYPLYVLAGRLWSSFLFFLPLPWSLSLFSAAAAAAACGVLFRIAREEGIARMPATFAALLFAFGPSLWGEANIPRVYALNALFVAGATLFALRWRRTRETTPLVVAFFLCGLGASNHLFMAVFGVALAVFAVASEPGLLRRPALLAGCAAAAAAGLLPYLYLPLRARAHPLLAWGDPRTLGAFGKVVLREDFWRRRWVESAADVGAVLLDFVRSLASETAWIGLPLAAVAIALARRRRWPVLLPLLVVAGNFVSMASHGSRSDIFLWHRYDIPSYFMVALLTGWGASGLADVLPRRAAGLLLAAPAVLCVTGFADFDRSRYRIGEDYSRIILSTIPPGSRLIASDDNILFVLMYLNLAEGRRPDVDLILEGVGGMPLAPLAFDPDKDAVFVTHHPNWKMPALDMAPVGLLFRVWRAGRTRPPPLPVPERLDGELDPRVPKDYLTQNLIGNFHYMRGVTAEDADWPAARREFGIAARAAPDNDVLFYNLGLIYGRNGLYDDALAAFRRSASINDREIPSLTRPRATDRVNEAEAERARIEVLERSLSSHASLSGLAPGSPAYGRALAALLEERGERAAARGRRLTADEAGATRP